ncbi:MAG: FapA family protein [Lachnospiraceae bacterium]|nr:FapA family protein [Lachnospiraceae bacterium]
MGDLNGYFELDINDKGTFIIIHGPQGQGKAVTFQETESYLKRKQLPYSGALLRSAVNSGSGEPVKLQPNPYYKVNEEMALRMSPDRMTLIGRLYPACGGTEMSLEEIEKDIEGKGFKAELDKESVEAFLSDRHFCTDFIVAHGTEPVEGENGYIEYKFNTDLSVKPAQNEDGSVDFFNLNTVCECKEGDVLAILHPAVMGTFGMDVTGEHIQPRPVENVTLNFGKNVIINEERTVLTAQCNGHVRLDEGRVVVSDVLVVKDVDTSTGNIDYDGNLKINGNVCAGFKVRASGDIEIVGVVEAAEVEAGGQVSVARGVNCMGNGFIKAGTNVIVKYIENATVTAGNYVQTECIINSKVTAGTTISVEGKRGFITGGPVRALVGIKAKTIGSDMGTDTVLEVGVDPVKKERAGDLQRENIEINKKMQQMQPMLLAIKQKIAAGVKIPPEQALGMKKLSDSFAAMSEQIKKNTIELGNLEDEMSQGGDAFIEVHEHAFPGTRLDISGSFMVLKTPYHYCKFVRERGEVCMKPLV